MVQAAAAAGVARTMRRTLVKQLSTLPTDPPLPHDPVDVEAWLDETIALTEAAARRLGQASGAQLGAAEPRLRTAILPTTEKSYDVRRTVTSSVLTLMATEGRLVRGRPLGSWTSRQHTWEPLAPDGEPWDEAEARAELVRRYLAAFGPATETDVVWWTGWAKGVTRAALARLDLVETGVRLAAGRRRRARAARRTRWRRCCRPSTRRRWAGRSATGSCPRTARRSTTPTATSARPSGGTGRSSAAGRCARTARSPPSSSPIAVGACAEAVDAAAAALEPRLEGATVTPSFPTPLEKRLRTA